MTMSTLKNVLKNSALASHYEQDYSDKLTYSEDELEKAYAEDKNGYDVASYEVIYFNGTAPSTTDADGKSVAPTEEEAAAAKDAAKKAADEAMERYQNGDTLEKIAKDYDMATYSKQETGTYSSSVVGDWVFDESRQADDNALLESDPSYYLVVFHSRGRNDYNTVDVRHILFLVDSSSLDTKSETYDDDLAKLQADAKAKAEDALQQWKSGDATEDSFAALATELTEDPGSKSTGGLYEKVYHNQMVQSFNDWCFDASRQAGDTDIVETNYGYHVMYFVGQNIPYWQVQVDNTLRTADRSAWMESLTADVEAAQASGMKYVG